MVTNGIELFKEMSGQKEILLAEMGTAQDCEPSNLNRVFRLRKMRDLL